jgi:hypothetical protein
MEAVRHTRIMEAVRHTHIMEAVRHTHIMEAVRHTHIMEAVRHTHMEGIWTGLQLDTHELGGASRVAGGPGNLAPTDLANSWEMGKKFVKEILHVLIKNLVNPSTSWASHKLHEKTHAYIQCLPCIRAYQHSVTDSACMYTSIHRTVTTALLQRKIHDLAEAKES